MDAMIREEPRERPEERAFRELNDLAHQVADLPAEERSRIYADALVLFAAMVDRVGPEGFLQAIADRLVGQYAAQTPEELERTVTRFRLLFPDAGPISAEEWGAKRAQGFAAVLEAIAKAMRSGKRLDSRRQGLVN